MCAAQYEAEAQFCAVDGAALTFRTGLADSADSAPTSARAGSTDTDAANRANGSAAAAAKPAAYMPLDPYIGREILGHIRISAVAGVGAMGTVYRATQGGVDREVAVKILHAELSSNRELVQRFEREAKVASKLTHPNAVHVHLAGQLPEGALYIVMEYLDGQSLQSAVAAANRKPWPLVRALHIALQLCDAVGEAHEHGIVHRDLKPENVMLVTRGGDPDFVKVLDFGIARMNSGDKSMATAAGLIFGTPRYLSPEAAQGKPAAPTSDVYALATMVYELLAGNTPFDGEQAIALLMQQIHDPPPSLRTLSPGVPAAVADVVMRNLAKSPDQRDAHARAFGLAIFEAARKAGIGPNELPAPSFFGRAQQASATPPPAKLMPTAAITAQLSAVAGALSEELAAAPASMLTVRQHPAAAALEAAIAAAVEAPPGVATIQLSAAPRGPAPASTAMPTRELHGSQLPSPKSARMVAGAASLDVQVAAFVQPHAGVAGQLRGRLEPTLDDDNLMTATPNLVAPTDLVAAKGHAPGSERSQSSAAPAQPPRAATEFAIAVVPQIDIGNSANVLGGQRVQLSAEDSARVQRAVDAAAEAQAAPALPTPLHVAPIAYASSEAAPLLDADAARNSDSPLDGPLDSPLGAYLDEPAGVPRARSRTFWIVSVCFVVGIAAATLAAYQLGYLGRASANQAASADALLASANAALKNAQYTQPEAGSVAALVREGATKYPQDARFGELRERCAEQLSSLAQAADARGEASAARGYALQAAVFVPLSAAVTKRLAKWLPNGGDDLALPSAKPSVSATAIATYRPRAIAPGFALSAAPGSSAAIGTSVAGPNASAANAGVKGAGILRVALARSVIEARPGQNVEFTATVAEDDHAPKTAADSAFFSFSGEGLSTRVAAQTDGLVYRSSLSFFQPGNYTIGFQATFAGKVAQGVATFHVAAPGEVPVQPRPVPVLPQPTVVHGKPPVPGVPSGVPVPAGSGAVKWM